MTRKRLGFFTRLLDDAPAARRYELAGEQIIHAERHGFDTAWVAQHHFHAAEGGLPSPFPFLTWLAARTSRIRLGTGVITLPMENPVRVAEDAVVLDLLSGGRAEIGFGTGATPASYLAFGLRHSERGPRYGDYLAIVRNAWAGGTIGHPENRLSPAAGTLGARAWQATFSVEGGRFAGRDGDGLLLSRTQPRPAEDPARSLWDIQNPIIDAYLEALPAGRAPRIMASRSLFVADDRAEALRLAEAGLRKAAEKFAASGHRFAGSSLADLIAALDVHVGTPDDVIESLARDRVLDRATDVVFQVHSVDPPHAHILRSIELIAGQVAPAFGWGTTLADAPVRKVAGRR